MSKKSKVLATAPGLKPEMGKLAKKVWKKVKEFGVCQVEFDSSEKDHSACIQILTKMIGKGAGYILTASGWIEHRANPQAGTWVFLSLDIIPRIKTKVKL